MAKEWITYVRAQRLFHLVVNELSASYSLRSRHQPAADYTGFY